jgi:hypothetical protein
MVEKQKTSDYERYVVDVNIAKQLKACGVSSPNMFFWSCNPQLGNCILHQSIDPYFGPPENKIPSYTAFELKEHFPAEVWVTMQRTLKRCRGLFHFIKYSGLYAVSLMVQGDGTQQMYEVHREEDTNEANACGRMLIYILQNDMSLTP